MHAVFVLPRFYPYCGGYENSILAIARCLVRRGHRVTVFTTIADDLESLWLPGYKTFPAEEFVIDGITVCRFPICYNRLRRRATRLVGLLPYWRWKAQFWTPGFRIPGLNAALRDTDADVFHVGPLPYNNLMYAGLRAAEYRRVPVIATPCVHLGEQNSDAVSRHYLQPHQIALLRHCDQLICMTDVEREQLQRVGIPASGLVTISYGVDLRQVTGGDPTVIRQRYNIDGPIVLHLGVKAYEKGSMTLVEAMKKLWAQGLQAWLVMAGPSLSAFDDYLSAQSQPLPKLINIPAFADRDKRDLLAAATVVAQPSRVESLGLVLLEAWANAKPVIAADIEVSLKLITQSKGGVLTRFGDTESLAKAVEEIVANPQLCQNMGNNGRSTAVFYEGTVLWPRHAELFEMLAGSPRMR
ncbi:MAG TPA: glycosyltransferase family 4 protein [Terriglobales bacterium]